MVTRLSPAASAVRKRLPKDDNVVIVAVPPAPEHASNIREVAVLA
ncbi:hypothetical protein BH24ACT14_BH24ACT14_20430 [soil metagenome]|jgi:hypothetical protein